MESKKLQSWSTEDTDFLRNNFDKLLYKEIATILGRTEKSIKRRCQNLGLRTRKISEVDHDYFDTWSASVSYILGFIVSDGCIQYDIKKHRYCLEFCIHKKDIEILEFIKFELKSNIDIRLRNNNLISLKITSKKICEKLISLGITPRKTGKEILPIGLPDEFLWDFIRGYFDGDGCINIRGRNGRTGTFSICSASKTIFDEIKNKTKIGTIVDRTKFTKSGNNFYEWIIRDQENLKKLYYSIYNSNFCLKRKYNKFTQYINNINSPTYRQIKEAALKTIAV